MDTPRKKPIFPTELAYALGLILMAFAAACTAKADFGMSMVVAPAYILHLKLSETLPWFSFGVAEYCLQGVLVALTALLVRRWKWYYLGSFVTAVLYGTLLDACIAMLAPLPAAGFLLRAMYFAVGTVLCALAVALFFHTYLPPEAYELIVKELAAHRTWEISRVKTAYDCVSVLLGIVLSFSFFGLGVFRGVRLGTVLCALINGSLIGLFSRLLETRFVFRDVIRRGDTTKGTFPKKSL